MQPLAQPSQMIVAPIPTVAATECGPQSFSKFSPPSLISTGMVVVAAASGLRVHARLSGIGSGSIRLESAVPIEPKISVEVSIPEYLSIQGTVGYCKHSRSTFQTAIYFRPYATPMAETGDRVLAHTLNPTESLGVCHVLDRTENSLSFRCETPAPLGAWIRVELARAVLFGEVNAVVPLADSFHAIGVQVDGVLLKLASQAAIF